MAAAVDPGHGVIDLAEEEECLLTQDQSVCLRRS
jgi:hypothetical protein